MLKKIFRRISNTASSAMGSVWAFVIALLVVVVWATTGPIFNFSDTWQLFINTGTTIVTFLMVFLIQNTQNRDGKAMQIKLDELIRATKARDTYIDIEELGDDELNWLSDEFRARHMETKNEKVAHYHSKIEKARLKRTKP